MIRDIKLEDVVWIHELNSVELGYPANYDLTKTQLKHLLTKEDEHFIKGYELNGKLAGYIHGQLYETLYNPSLINILALVVNEDNQGLGIGKSLIEALEKAAQERSISGVRINSGMYREDAHQFYEYMGFSDIKLQKRYLKLFDNDTK